MNLLDASFEHPDFPKAPEAPTADYGIEVATLRELNLEGELLKQYQKANRLMVDAELDKATTPPMKAAVMNSIRGILADIVKMQTELYNAERLKTLEAILLSVLKEFPALNNAFLAKYKEALGE
jgi:hypothetical protein